MLIKRKSRYLSTDSDHFLIKRRESDRGKNLKYLSHNNGTIKRSTSHGQIKRLNSGIFSKYSLYQKDKVQFKILVNQSNLDGKDDTSTVLTEKVKLKTIFNGKCFKNLYQKINHIQNNLREYVNNESQELKLEQNHICNKLLNFGLKNTKSNTFYCPWNFSQLGEKSNLRDIIFNSNCKSDSKSLQSSNLSTTESSIKPIALSPKIATVDTETKSISVETKSKECSSKELKTEISQTDKEIKESSLKTQNKEINSDEPQNDSSEFAKSTDKEVSSKIVENHSNESSSTCDIAEKTNVIPEVKTNVTENGSIISPPCNTKKNRRAKHTRSSAVCLSSNDIKGILGQSKKFDDSQSSKRETSSSNYVLERSLNDSIKYEGNCHREALLTNESLERKKLLSRNNYQPSLTTLNSTQFCYNDHFPTVRIPFMQRNSQTVQQSWNNYRRY